jgi:hypothetical protein
MLPISKELLAPILAVGASVILFLVMLIFQSSGTKVKASKTDADGTKYVQENGQTVRRSTR